MKFCSYLFAEGRNGRVIRTLKAHIYHKPDHGKLFRVKLREPFHGIEKGQGILSSGYTYGNLVTFVYHLIVLHGTADIA